MNLTTLDISAEQAQAGYREYRDQLRRERRGERSAEDAAIAAGYYAAAKGLPLISLSAVVQAGGFHDNNLPRIAVCRASAERVWAQWNWHGSEAVVFTDRLGEWGRGALVGEHTVRVPLQKPHGYGPGGTTIVPNVPPRFRRRGWERLHILWEVERWEPIPPRDPALLRHIRGDMWAVLAVWDLTEIERHVLGQRAVRQ